MTTNLPKIELSLKEIADTFLENRFQSDDFGLLYGNMGVSIFLFHYARYTGKSEYGDYAVELIEKISNQIFDSKKFDYSRGLAGIGIGIDYLIQNEFISADEDILNDLDKNMKYSTFIDKYTDMSLYTGLMGYGRYWLCRIGKKDTDDVINHILAVISDKIFTLTETEQFDVWCFLSDLNHLALYSQPSELLRVSCQLYCKSISNCIPEMSFPRLGYAVAGRIVRKYLLHKYFGIDWYGKSLSSEMILNEDKNQKQPGLLDGLSAYGLCLLSALSPREISWIGLH